MPPQSLGKEDGEAEKKEADSVCSEAMLQAAGAPGQGCSCSCVTGSSPSTVVVTWFLVFL